MNRALASTARHGRRRARRGATVTAALACVLGLTLASCGSNESADEPADSTGTEAPEEPTDTAEETTGAAEETAAPTGGGDVVLAVAIEPVSMDAWRAFSEVGAPGFRNTVETLFVLDFESRDLKPVLGTELSVVDDKTVEVTLREGVSFHDGSAFDAEAVVTNFNFVFDEENAFDLLDFLGPIAAEATGPNTVRLSTPEPDPLLPVKLTFVPISSAQQLTESPDTYSTNLIGTGPYVFDEWQRGQSLTYSLFEDWWGFAAGMTDDSVAPFQTAKYDVRTEDAVRASMVAAGEAQLAQFVSPEECAVLASGADTKCETSPSVETIFIRMDTNGQLFSDPRVREALNLAVDSEGIATNLMGGSVVPSGQIVNSTAAGHSDALQPYPYDPEKAKALLEEAAADGVPVSQEIPLVIRDGVFAQSNEVVQAVSNMLNEVGFNTKIQVVDPEAFGQLALINIKDIPEDRNLVFVHGHGQELFDFGISYGFYYSCDGILSAYCNEEAEALYQAALPLSGAERDAALQELNEFVYADNAMGYIGHQDLAYGMAQSLMWTPPLDHRLLVIDMRQG